MALQKFAKDTIPFHAGQEMNTLYIIAGGSLEARYEGFSLTLQKGDVAGLADLAFGTYSCDYHVIQEASLIAYPYQDEEQLAALFCSAPDMGPLFLTSAVRMVTELMDHYVLQQFECDNFYQYILEKYREYKQFCVHFGISPKTLPGMDELSPLSLEEEIPSWLSSYYDALRTHAAGGREFFMKDPWLAAGFLLRISQDTHLIFDVCNHMADYLTEGGTILLNENRMDFFDLFTELYFRAYRTGEDTIPIGALISKLFIQIEGTASISRELYRQRVTEYRTKVQLLEETPPQAQPDAPQAQSLPIRDSLPSILEYGKCKPELIKGFTDSLLAYKACIDKNSADDDSRTLRLRLAKLFYEVYQAVFLASLEDEKVPPLILMFLNFGYVDEELAGNENAAYLYSIAGSFRGDASRGIYTVYEWLMAIYEGKKSPSRNEFDTDFEGYIREQRVSGKISPQEEEQMLSDRVQKVLFELSNMFPTVNKVTYGRITNFCPVFSEHNVLKDLKSALVTPQRLLRSLGQIRSADYGAFYRETIYSNPDCGIAKEYLQIEILPDIILMPNIGTRGVMWQEIEGRRRTTPARMMISAFCLEDLTALLIRLTGEYRWEMCKRVQGARWNDVSDPSLTSEYSDYIQFYRKNHELSPDAKEKIKNALQKAKNSYKEFYVQDYITWILHEGSGSPRLNKIARGILFSYCPFSKGIREQLKSNPLYSDMLDRYNTKTSQKLHHLDILIQRIQKSGLAVPPELKAQYDYLSS